MEKDLFSQEIKQKASQLQIILNENQINHFFKYMNLLLEWNEKMNLTAITDPKEIILKHFIDSMIISQYINNNDRILDIGTGAGFPGIPLKILNTENEFTLLDSLNKRINFLTNVIQNLGLEKVRAIHGRAEEFIKLVGERENYDIVTSRAVAKLNVLLEYMLPFTKIGGKCICMKAFEIDEELKDAQKAIEILGGEIEKVDIITLPESEIKRKIVVIKKIKNTLAKYPRKAGTPEKEPII